MVDYLYIDVGDGTSNPDKIRNGIVWLSQTSENETSVLLIPTLGNLEGHIEQVIGKEQAKYLKKNRSILSGNTTIHLTTNNIMDHSHENVRILAVYQRDKSLDEIESRYQNISEILVIPWIAEDIQEWVITRGAKRYE